jgi:hypothetical protein
MSVDGSDVLVANWVTEASTVTGAHDFWLYDTADYDWFVIKCDLAAFASVASTETFLKQLLKWPYVAPPVLNIKLQYAPASGTGLLAGSALLVNPERGDEYRLSALRLDSGCYLLLKIGKGFFALGYPEGGAYVPERFPPLKDLIKTWSKERILAEVGRMWSVSRPFANNNYRDRILIREAAKRGLGPEDLRRLLLPPSAPGLIAWSQRAAAVMMALVDTHQLDANHGTLADIVMTMGHRDDVGKFALEHLFDALQEHSTFDDTGLALRCLSECLYPSAPLIYLAQRGNGEATYAKVAAAVVTEQMAKWWQGTALKNIRARLDKEKVPH